MSTDDLTQPHAERHLRPSDPEATGPSTDRVPGAVWLVALGVFAMVTSEFMAAGLLPEIADDVGVSVGAASLLISGFAGGQVLGAWLLGMPLTRFQPRLVLAGLLVLFAIAQTIGVLSPWPVLLGLRMLSGLSMAAFFSIGLGTVTRLVPGETQPRATSTVFAGVTVGTALGLPLATFAGQSLSWTTAFHLDTVAVLGAALALSLALPRLDGVTPQPLRDLLRPLADARLWGTFVTAALGIGGTLVAFGFFSAILQEQTGVSRSAVPWLLALYGVASVLGNWLVGRLTHTGPSRVVAIGLVVLAGGLLAFRLAPTSLPVVVAALVVVGLSGVSLNAAYTARIFAVGGATPAVMAMTPTVVTGGILIGTGTGGIVAGSFGLLAPLSVGAALAVAALATVALDTMLTGATTRRAARPPRWSGRDGEARRALGADPSSP